VVEPRIEFGRVFRGVAWAVSFAGVPAENVREVRMLMKNSDDFTALVGLKVHAVPHIGDGLTSGIVANVVDAIIRDILDVGEGDRDLAAWLSVRLCLCLCLCE